MSGDKPTVTQADREAYTAFHDEGGKNSTSAFRANVALGRLDDCPLMEAFARHRTNTTTELVEALREIACFDDTRANEYLERYGLFTLFDEPGSVERARKALTLHDRALGK